MRAIYKPKRDVAFNLEIGKEYFLRIDYGMNQEYKPIKIVFIHDNDTLTNCVACLKYNENDWEVLKHD